MDDLLKQLKESIEKGAQVVTNISSDLIELTKLRSSLALLQEQRKKAYTELGKVYFTMHKEDTVSPTLLGQYCDKVAEIDNQIIEKEAAIKKLQVQADSEGLQICNCGAVNPKDASFCMQCGSSLKKETL